MIKVLHLTSLLETGGIQKWLLNMLQLLPRDEIAMDVLCNGAEEGELAEEFRNLGATVYHCPLRLTHVGYVRQLSRILREGGYDLVHNHLASTAGPGVWVARQLNIPVISTFHSTKFGPQTWTRQIGIRQLRAIYLKCSIKYALKHSRFVTGTSRAIVHNLVPNSDECERCRVLNLGVDLDRWQAAATPAESTIPEKKGPTVLHVGRFVEAKNHSGLLRIFEHVRQQLPSAQLWLVGDGRLKPEIERLIKQRHLEDCVTCLGNRTDVPELMHRADVLLFPSLNEGFGMVAIEANAAGLPVVASKIPGIDEAVIDGFTGVLHGVRDERRLAKSVVRFLTDENFAWGFRQRGRKWVQENFTLQRSALRVHRLYQECLKSA